MRKKKSGGRSKAAGSASPSGPAAGRTPMATPIRQRMMRADQEHSKLAVNNIERILVGNINRRNIVVR